MEEAPFQEEAGVGPQIPEVEEAPHSLAEVEELPYLEVEEEFLVPGEEVHLLQEAEEHYSTKALGSEQPIATTAALLSHHSFEAHLHSLFQSLLRKIQEVKKLTFLRKC